MSTNSILKNRETDHTIQRYKNPALFFILSTLIPWVFWFAAGYVSHLTPYQDQYLRIASILACIGLFAPLGVVYGMTAKDKELRKDIAKRFFNFKEVKPVYAMLTCLIMPVSIMLAQGISLLFGYSHEQFMITGNFTFSSGIFPVWFLLILAPVIEELAWHTYGTDSLRSKFNLFNTSILFGIIWGIWHLPLSSIRDYYQSNVVNDGLIYGLNFLVSIIPFVLLMNWLYYKTGRNIIVTMVFHITAGLFNELFAPHPDTKLIQTVLLLILAIIIVVKEKKLFFDKTPKLRKTLSISLFLIACVLFSTNIYAQDNRPVQTIRGVVTDLASGTPLSFVSVALLDLPQTGATTDDNGEFTINHVPVGRHDLQATFVGYEPAVFREIMLTSAKEVYLEIGLKEGVFTLEDVVVKPRINKEEALNSMALTGARMFSVEEAGRFAGGMDDPARLVSSFAGVTSAVGNNGISIHGNAPGLLQWRLEDVEIPNPNHFADVASLGGGVLSSLSSHVLGNSDFYTSAFPAEYNNAVSGIFDMRLRNGNSQKFQHTLQAGILGLDIASEGPLSRKHNASYIFNYRYSTTGLMNKISPAGDREQVLDYQDVNFKLNFPTQQAGVFSLWATAWKDQIRPEIESPEEWDYMDDAKDSQMKQTSAAGGLSHRYFFGTTGLLKTTLAATYSKSDAWEDIYDFDMNSSSWLDFKSRYTNLVLTSSFNKKYSSKHTNKTGITLTNMHYDMDFDLAPFYTEPMERISEGKGNTSLLSTYTSSLINFNERVSATAGVNGQFLTLNNSWTIEPRVAIKWQASFRSSFGLGYGLHSRMEKLDVYFVKTNATGDKLVNKDLDFTKTHHVSVSYNYKIADDKNLKIEPYFQYLYNVPVIADSSYSVLNRSTFYVEDALVNQGKGRNYGIDITFEKYVTRGFYYMVTASVFSSKYQGGDGVWHNTKFNRNYVINGLTGKEWMMGRNRRDVLGINLKLTLQGGDRYSPVDEQATLNHPYKETQYDETRAYSKQLSPMFLASYTFSYRMNRSKVSHEFAVKGMNATGYKEYFGHEYNLKTGVTEARRLKNSIFNIVYRIDF